MDISVLGRTIHNAALVAASVTSPAGSNHAGRDGIQSSGTEAIKAVAATAQYHPVRKGTVPVSGSNTKVQRSALSAKPAQSRGCSKVMPIRVARRVRGGPRRREGR